MRIEFLAIGDELLDGRLNDSNSFRLAQTLRKIGLNLSHISVVPDVEPEICDALAGAHSRGAQLVVISGGLGPTDDDLTKAAFARWIGTEVVTDSKWVGVLEARYAKRGLELTENRRRQAMVPKMAKGLENLHGAALGFFAQHEGTAIFSFPGVPSEFDGFCDKDLVPWLKNNARVSGASMTLRTFGLAESDLAEKVQQTPLPDAVNVGYRVAFPEVHLELKGQDENSVEVAAVSLRKTLGTTVYGQGDESLVQRVVSALAHRGLRLATAESCTAGLLAATIADIAGASAVLEGSIVAYDNRVKIRDLGVPVSVIEAEGAVSAGCVEAMASSVRHRFDVDIAISISGIAGPTGGSKDKPIGTVWLGLSTAQRVCSKAYRIDLGRNRNRRLAVWKALDLIRKELEI